MIVFLFTFHTCFRISPSSTSNLRAFLFLSSSLFILAKSDFCTCIWKFEFDFATDLLDQNVTSLDCKTGLSL